MERHEHRRIGTDFSTVDEKLGNEIGPLQVMVNQIVDEHNTNDREEELRLDGKDVWQFKSFVLEIGT